MRKTGNLFLKKQSLLMELFGITVEEIGVVGISRLQDLVLER